MFKPASRSHRGFTLIELLVVIAIIALLVGILLPALKEARKSGQALKSAANLSGILKAHYGYAVDYRDSFINPWRDDGGITFNGNPPGWDIYFYPGYQQSDVNEAIGLRPGGDGSRFSEPFGFIIGIFLSPYMTGQRGKITNQESFSIPGDFVHVERMRRIERVNAAAATPFDSLIPDSGYLYSPVFWTASDRYTSTFSLPALSNSQASAQRWLRRNRFDQVQFPTAKALHWERGDYSRTSRLSSANTRVRIAPSWLNPEAQPQVGFVDGSVDRVKMARLHQVANTGTTEERATYEPAGGFFNIVDQLLPDQSQPGDNPAGDGRDQVWENGTSGTKAYKQFFWGTRNGIRGRDALR